MPEDCLAVAVAECAHPLHCTLLPYPAYLVRGGNHFQTRDAYSNYITNITITNYSIRYMKLECVRAY